MRAFYVAGIIREDDGSGYSVYFPDVPNVAAGGQTIQEAIANAEDGLYVALRGLAAQRQEIPKPSAIETVKEKVRAEREADGLPYPQDALYQYISAPVLDTVPKRINITVPRGILGEIDKKAKSAGMTRSGFFVEAAQAYRIKSMA